jgi:RHS repeat-associated protein
MVRCDFASRSAVRERVRKQSAEKNKGEFVMLWNRSADRMDFRNFTLVNEVNNDTIWLDSASVDYLAPDQELLIANYGVSNLNWFRDISMLPSRMWDSGAAWLRDTTFRMSDTGGELRLFYEDSLSGAVLVYGMDYGGSTGYDGANAFVADSLLDSLHERAALNGLQRFGYNKQHGSFKGGISTDLNVLNFGVLDGEININILPKPSVEIPDGKLAWAKGSKVYELKNHLGNVLVVVSDFKDGQEGGTADGSAEFYQAEIVSAQDYYAFGGLMPGRNYSSPSYRYGFNGMEKDDEVKGSGNSYTTEFRQYDPRLGRWLSDEPKPVAWESGYAAFRNNPICFVDPNGDFADYGKDGKQNSSPSTLYIIIQRPSEFARNYYNTADMGTFKVIVADNIIQASKMVSDLNLQGEYDNLIVHTHGNVGLFQVRDTDVNGWADDGSGRDPSEPDWRRDISNENLKLYNKDSEKLKQDDPISHRDIEAFGELLKHVKDNGICLINSCNSGAEDPGMDLARNLHILDPRLTFYLNKDQDTYYSTDGRLQIWTGGQGLTVPKSLNGGFLKISPDGSLINLIDEEDHTGNVYLDPREGKTAINEQLKK